MAKTKRPLFSLASTGSIGDVLTTQRRGDRTLLRQKPTPTYRLTLHQQYQRWDFLDAIHSWVALPDATRAFWATEGARKHLTGQQAYIQYYLKNLPNLQGRWPLDETTGAVAHDTSLNLRHGTIYGASPATGIINGALFFDGLNDYVSLPSAAISATSTELSVGFRVSLVSTTTDYFAFSANKDAADDIRLHFRADSRVYIGLDDGNPAFPWTPYWTHNYAPNSLHTVFFTWDGTTLILYSDGVEVARRVGTFTFYSPLKIYLGRRTIGGPTWHNGVIDHVIILDRCLTPAEILYRSERRYPP